MCPGGTVAAATWDTPGGLVFSRMIFNTAAMLDRNANERRARAYSRSRMMTPPRAAPPSRSSSVRLPLTEKTLEVE